MLKTKVASLYANRELFEIIFRKAIPFTIATTTKNTCE
jgi:hypothetical protein